MNWHWIRCQKDGHAIVSHAASTMTKAVVISNLEGRGCQLTGVEPLTELHIDMPGMICTDRPMELVGVAGLDLHIPSEDIGAFVLAVEQLEPREVGGQAFFKLHCWMRALCLSVGERLEFLAGLRSCLPKAEQRASEFYATRKVPSEVLREANARVTGVPVEKVPNLGANRLDRFKLKSGGRA